MPIDILFYIVFLSQILLVSLYLPGKISKRIRYVFESYPPSEFPKLYPEPFEYYEKSLRNFRYMNIGILLVGLVLLAVMLGYSGRWDVVFPYFMIQLVPLILVEVASLKYFKLMRNASTTRKAELHPRRLSDVISPTMISMVMSVYAGLIVFVVYIEQFEFPWFGGYWNVVGMTAMNLFFAGIIFWNLYGQKQDPYQAYEDRIRQTKLTAKQLVFVSIAATLFIVINVTLHAIELRHLEPFAMSLYLQVIAMVSIRGLRIDTINFEVYKSDPSQESNEKSSFMMSEEESSHSPMSVGLWIGIGLGVLFGAFIVIEGGTVTGFALGAGIGMALGMFVGVLLEMRKSNSPTR